MPVGLPAASSPLATTWMPLPAAVIVIILLFGIGPGSYFDLARFSFPVPTAESVWASAMPANDRTATTSAATREPCRTLIRPPSKSGSRDGGATIHTLDE